MRYIVLLSQLMLVVLCTYTAAFATEYIPILGMHDVIDQNNPRDNPPNRRHVSMDYYVQDLEVVLRGLISDRYYFLTAEEFLKYYIYRLVPVPAYLANRPKVMLTFDDGYHGLYDNLLPLLRRLHTQTGTKIPAILFLNPSLLGQQTGNIYYLDYYEVIEGANAGFFDVQSHSYTHRYLTELNDSELRFEATEARKLLLRALNYDKKVAKCLAYPFGAHNDHIKAFMSDHYAAAFAYNNQFFVVSERPDKYSIPRLYVNEKTSPAKLLALLRSKAKETTDNTTKSRSL